MTIGEKIKFLRENSKLTQKHVANELGIAINTLSQYENNNRQPDYETLAKICNFYGVYIDYFFVSYFDFIGDDFEIPSPEDEYLQRARSEKLRIENVVRRITSRLQNIVEGAEEIPGETSFLLDQLGDLFVKHLENEKVIEIFEGASIDVESEIIEYLTMFGRMK